MQGRNLFFRLKNLITCTAVKDRKSVSLNFDRKGKTIAILKEVLKMKNKKTLIIGILLAIIAMAGTLGYVFATAGAVKVPEATTPAETSTVTPVTPTNVSRTPIASSTQEPKPAKGDVGKSTDKPVPIGTPCIVELADGKLKVTVIDIGREGSFVKVKVKEEVIETSSSGIYVGFFKLKLLGKNGVSYSGGTTKLVASYLFLGDTKEDILMFSKVDYTEFVLRWGAQYAEGVYYFYIGDPEEKRIE